MEKIKINLDLLLPEIPDERDQCVTRLLLSMQHHKGIEKSHIIPQANSNKAQLCFHYNPDFISLDEIQTLAWASGAAITRQFSHLMVDVQGVRDMGQAKAIERDLDKLAGLLESSVSVAGMIAVEFDRFVTDKETILSAIRKTGLTIINSKQEHAGHKHQHEAGDDHDHEHDHSSEDGEGSWKKYLPVAAGLVMLTGGIILDQVKPSFFCGWLRFVWYAMAYLPLGLPVAIKGVRYIFRGDVFTEFMLMTLATVGAFYIGEYPEGVAVMLFYTVGELFQDAAVSRAKRSIKALLDIRPDKAYVKRDGSYIEEDPAQVNIGDTIRIKSGEKVPLDSEMLGEGSTFNTSALTGESMPSLIGKGEPVLAGMINQGKVVELKVTRLFNDSSLARILSMVQEATTRKAQTEQFIRRFSRIYTPVVVFLALAIALVPFFVVQEYVFNQWLYRSLIFLVISCPCALVISIPLGYFGGIGAASRNGILFKGSNFLDLMTKVNTVVMDKTGTLTKGIFKVQEVFSYGVPESEWLPMVAALEAQSTHPVAQAIVKHAGKGYTGIEVKNPEEISGLGLKGIIEGKEALAGSSRLMAQHGIAVDERITGSTDTIVIFALDKKIAGYMTIADEIKEDSKQAIELLHQKGIKTIMLSGDKQAVVDQVARTLDIDNAFGDLLPEHKVQKVEALKKDPNNIIAFVGDGVNDAPVLALSDVGIAMGGLGSDAAIETADVIIQTDHPSKIVRAINIGKATNRVVWQNIIFAFSVKVIVLILGAGGIATMWEAVFADVGVALIAILNAIRIQRMKFL